MIGKGDIARDVARTCDVTQELARKIIDATFDRISETLVAGGDVVIKGFVSITVVPTMGRTMIVQSTGTVSPAKLYKRIRARFSTSLRNRVKKS